MLLQHNTCHAALQSTSLSSVDCHNGPVVRTNYNNMQWCIAVLGFSLRSCCRPLTRCASPLTSFNTAGWVKVRPWCTSGGMDHCYDWGVQTHRTMRSRVALELFEISGLRFAKVWGKRRRGAGGFEPWMINHLSCQWRSLHCCFEGQSGALYSDSWRAANVSGRNLWCWYSVIWCVNMTAFFFLRLGQTPLWS